MKTYKIFQKIVFALTVILFSGCSDNLDVTPESKWEAGNFYSTRQEVDIALAGIYGSMADNDSFASSIFQLEVGTDEMYWNRRFSSAWPVALNLNTPSDAASFKVWSQLYETINLSNLFLENVSESVIGSKKDFNAFSGEVRFLRAFCFLKLTQFWNEVPLRLTSTKDQNDSDVPAASLEDIYEAITNDFKFAAENLLSPTDEDYIPGRAHKYAANGLLARTYLKMSGEPFNGDFYQEALDQCEIVMNSGSHGLTQSLVEFPDAENPNGYEQVFLDLIGSVYNTREVLFEISFQSFVNQGIGRTEGGFGALWGISYSPNALTGEPSGWNLVSAHVALESLYDLQRDYRYLWNIAQYVRNSNGDITRATSPFSLQYGIGKYKRWRPTNIADVDTDFPRGCAGRNDCPSPEGVTSLENNLGVFNRNSSSINFPVIRYSDILLMYAEAANVINGGPTDKAMSALNDVRNRAGLPSIGGFDDGGNPVGEGVGDNEDTFFRELVNERSRELCFEGVRRHDLIRWGILGEKYEDLKVTVTNFPGYNNGNQGHRAVLRSANNFDPARHLSLPYPLIEVNGNQALDQKPEWSGQ